jgi:outer membrane protein OmpA-like peptidoglycan-associated protein
VSGSSNLRVIAVALVLALWVPGRVQAQEGPAGAGEEAWLLGVSGGAGLVVGEPQQSLFGPVVSGALAGYRSLGPAFLLGLGLRGAVFTNGKTPSGNRVDPANGGLGSLDLLARFRPFPAGPPASRALGLWLEAGAGAGVTGHLVRPSFEAGAGYGFSLRPLVLGPTVRYLHVLQPGTGAQGADAHVALAGIELILGDPRPLAHAEPPPPAPSLPAAPAPRDTDGDGIADPDDRCPTEPEDKDGFEDADGCPDPDNDKDGILDKNDKCPNEAEVVNGVDDEDGCPDVGVIQLIDDRVVLEERLLFPTERARVSPEGKRALEAVATLWKQHPEWERLDVEGHADVRGPDKYNLWLSEERAHRVQTVLISLGVPADKLTAKGFGNTRPRAEGRSPEALQQNRRVELVVIRKRPAGDAKPVEPPPAPGGPRP